jgi:hypothetical protein
MTPFEGRIVGNRAARKYDRRWPALLKRRLHRQQMADETTAGLLVVSRKRLCLVRVE